MTALVSDGIRPLAGPAVGIVGHGTYTRVVIILGSMLPGVATVLNCSFECRG